jgi:hypothetical protein
MSHKAIIIIIFFILIFSRINISAAIYCTHKGNNETQYRFILPDFNLNHHQWVPNWAMTSEPGKPQLPHFGFLFQSNTHPISIKIIDIKQSIRHFNDIAPAPIQSNAQFVYQKDRQTYESEQFYPSRIFWIDPPSKWSGTNVVRVLIRPFQWNPVTRQLKIIHHITFSITCPNQYLSHTKQNRCPQIDPLKSQIIMNYSPHERSLQKKRQTKITSNQKLNISVHQNAIYQLTYSDLEQYHYPVTQKQISYLQLWHNDQQIPLHIVSKSSYLQKGNAILFYGQSIDSHYTDKNVYQLFWGETPGLRMSMKDASPNQNKFAEYAWHTLHFEKNYGDNFWPATPGAPQVDFVFWDLLIAPDTFSTTFDLPNLDLSAPNTTTQLCIFFQEKTNSFHNINIQINDHTVFQNQFHADSRFQVDISLDTSMLKFQNNKLNIQSELSSGYWTDKLYINNYSIRYPISLIAQNNMQIIEPDEQNQNISISGFTNTKIHIFDISHPTFPEILSSPTITHSNTNYHVQFFNHNSKKLFICSDSNFLTPELKWASSEQLKSKENEANYIIITAQKFVSAVQPLLDEYRHQGIRTMVISPDMIFDLFNGGIVHPQAIQTFLAYAFNCWKTPPEYVLLVGDSNIDYLDYFETGKQNEVPVYLTFMDGVGLVPNDHYYVCIDGEDLYPDMTIGRLPGKNHSDIEKLVMKRINYSKHINTTRQRNLFISDNDAEDIFAKITQNSMGYLSDRMEQVHLALTDSAELNQLKEHMFDYLNHGTLIATYMGHGSIDNWSGEPILHANEIHRINSGTPLTFFVSLNCMSGFFALPDRYSLSQKLVIAENKGAIAIFAPTAMAQVWEIDILAQSLFSLIRSNPNLPVGDLVMGAKMAAFAKGIRGSTVQMFTLTGDPLVRLNIPSTKISGDFDSDGGLTLKDTLLLMKHLGRVE